MCCNNFRDTDKIYSSPLMQTFDEIRFHILNSARTFASDMYFANILYVVCKYVCTFNLYANYGNSRRISVKML